MVSSPFSLMPQVEIPRPQIASVMRSSLGRTVHGERGAV